ncbi:MAG: J domain-containing protein [Treponema sp.]|nr:J domain-containing protein [Treponema sp.]
MRKFFTNPQTLEELKQQYRALAMQHHPDRGGCVEVVE